jgi:hypothetical protein
MQAKENIVKRSLLLAGVGILVIAVDVLCKRSPITKSPST